MDGFVVAKEKIETFFIIRKNIVETYLIHLKLAIDKSG